MYNNTVYCFRSSLSEEILQNNNVFQDVHNKYFCTSEYITNPNNNNNNNTLFNEDLQIKLQLVQLVSNLVLLSSRNILHHVITILRQLTYFRYVVYTVTDASQTHNIHRYITTTQH
jgi:hypothetical protein